MRRFPHRFRAPLLALVLLSGACRAAPTPTVAPTATAAATAVAAASLQPPTAVPTPQPTPTPSPTPLPQPALEAADQTVSDEGVLRVQRIVATRDGWVAARDVDGALLGVSPVTAGTHTDLTIAVDPLQVSRLVTVALYSGGETFAPEESAPVLVNGFPVEASILVEAAVVFPALSATDQKVGADGVAQIARYVAREDGWIAVYNDADGAPGERVGLVYVRAGEGEDVPVAVTWRRATPRLHLVLHRDTDRLGRFDYPASDPAVIVRGEPVAATINAVFPPDIYVLDQPIRDGRIVVERVVAYGPTWLVAYFSNPDGTPGNIVGSTFLEAGVHELVEAPVAATTAEALILQLHADTNDIGEFEYPQHDRPLTDASGRAALFPFSVNPGNYVVSADQPLTIRDGQADVIVPLAVTDVPFWATIRAERNGAPGAVLGYTWASAGIQRNLVVRIDATAATPRLFVVLHLDAGEPQQFEYPDGRDIELQRRRAPLAAPFLVLDEG